MSNQQSPVIILVRPQIGENIGMSARAAYNGGLTQLRLVNPKEPWPNPKSVIASAGAHVILDDVKVYDNLEDSMADLQFVLATSARQRGMTKHVYNAESAIKKLYEEIERGHRVGIMFGPERSGLDNDDLSRADGLIEIPMNPDYTSLNLAQAVLIMAYEWIKIKIQKPDVVLPMGDTTYATKQELIALFDHLEHELDHSGFLRVEHKRDLMVRNIRNMFLRVGYTSQEVRTLRGIIASLVDPYYKDRKKP
jgi:tRNA/rRNA methyltransferase